MKHKHVAFGIVGLLIGLVLGFFAGQILVRPSATPASEPVRSASNELPEGHPSIDTANQLKEMEQHARENPDHIDVRIRLGDAYYDMQRFDAAIPWYEEALKLEPARIVVLNDLSICYLAVGKADKAIELAKQSLELEKDNPVGLQNLGWFYLSSDNLPAAIETWEKLIAVHPDFQNIEAVKKQLDNAKAHAKGEHS